MGEEVDVTILSELTDDFIDTLTSAELKTEIKRLDPYLKASYGLQQLRTLLRRTRDRALELQELRRRVQEAEHRRMLFEVGAMRPRS